MKQIRSMVTCIAVAVLAAAFINAKEGESTAKDAPPAWVVSSTGTVARAEAGDVGAMGEIAKATQEGAVGNTTIAEKVADVASKANEILSKVNMSRQGAENLKKQVAKFKV